MRRAGLSRKMFYNRLYTYWLKSGATAEPARYHAEHDCMLEWAADDLFADSTFGFRMFDALETVLDDIVGDVPEGWIRE